LHQLGQAERVVCDKDTTTINGGGGDTAAVQSRCTKLRRQVEDKTSDWDKEKLQESGGRAHTGGIRVL
jgi:chaperonin GroEL